MTYTQLSNAAFCWYNYRLNSNILCISTDGEKNYLEGTFIQSNTNIVLSKIDIPEVPTLFDYILVDNSLETCEAPEAVLASWLKYLSTDGVLLMTMNNRFGIRYFCGDKDPYTWKSFDGVDNYRYSYLNDLRQVRPKEVFNGRCYDKNGIINIITKAGAVNYKFFGVFPGLEKPSYFINEEYDPKENISTRVTPVYNSTHSIIIDEKMLYSALQKNGMIHQMANAFLIECSKQKKLSDVQQITSSFERGKENAFYTIIREHSVEKKPVFKEADSHLGEILKNEEYLYNAGVKVIHSERSQYGLSQSFIQAPTGQVYLEKLFHNDIDSFLRAMDQFRDIILKSSEHISPSSAEYKAVRNKRKERYEFRKKNKVEEPEILDDIFAEQEEDEGIILRYGYIDMVPLNSFFMENDFYIFDQEYVVDYCPANMIINRMIATFYSSNYEECYNIYPDWMLLERYGINENRLHWEQMEWRFLDFIKNKGKWEKVFKGSLIDVGDVYENRNRLQYYPFSREQVFDDIFDKIEDKDIFLFGSGKYADLFVKRYGDLIRLKGILDNNSEKHGTLFHGIEIVSPDDFHRSDNDYIIIICARDNISIRAQLEEQRIYNYRIYNPHKKYGEYRKKDKKVGYVAGAFDMFHIGHLNLLRRAKERCDYLIAGVMSDQRMYDLKKKYPVIPCGERMQVVAGCRYVDQVEELPADRAGIMDAYNMFHFDCMFSGDDHAEDPGWLAERERLREQGSDIIFVSYTKETSSSMIRRKMKEDT